MTVLEDKPKLFKKKAAIEARQKKLQEPHIKPLSDYVEALRLEYGTSEIPYFDPSDGGINAKCLFLLEAPGRNAVKSNFISRDNDDESAKNFFLLNNKAKLPRNLTISWNIVPCYIGTEDKRKIRAAKADDVSKGKIHLLRLLKLLPKLRAVVFVGQKAKGAETDIRRNKPDLKLFYSPHPSPLFVNHHPDNKDHILKVLKEVSQFIGAN